MRIAAAVLLTAGAALAQLPEAVNPHPTNINFALGDPGAIPPGWDFFSVARAAGYTAELHRGDCPGPYSACVRFRAPERPSAVPAAELSQSFPAADYVGRKIRFRSWLRVQQSGQGDLELRMRVDYANGRRQFFDSVDGPVNTAQPQRREVVGFVEPGALRVEIWARFHPNGQAWLFDPSFDALDDSPARPEEGAVRALIRKFADARNAHDGAAVAALYSEDGEWFGPDGGNLTRGRQALAALWGSMTGQVERTIEGIEFPSSRTAVIRVATQYEAPASLHHETFVAVKEGENWRVRLHQTDN